MLKKPPRLQPGDTIGVIAPGTVVPRETLERGFARLEALGYRVRYRPDIFSQYGEDIRFAGSHERRGRELCEMLDDPAVRAVFCARGGYGCNYLIDYLSQRPLPDPKILMGYSDITTLHSYFLQQGWVAFQGPMVAVDFAQGWDELGPALESTEPWEVGGQAGLNLKVVREGSAEGVLLGGCLSLLVTTLGTAREIEWDGAIVFLEDLNEAPYRVDRMLFHLKEAGKFDGVEAVIFGEMKDCGEPDLLRCLDDLNVPVVTGLPVGHTSNRNVCLPLGVRARLENDRLFILEGAVS